MKMAATDQLLSVVYEFYCWKWTCALHRIEINCSGKMNMV